MKKVPLYTLSPDEICEIQNKKFRVTATKTIKKEGNHSFQNMYLKQVDGNEFVYAPAGLMVTKDE